MCTSIVYPYTNNQVFFGRTMDFSYPMEANLYVIPQNNSWYSIDTSNVLQDTYSFISIGQEYDDLLVFFDGVNEKGFACAALYFAGYASYSTYNNNSKNYHIAAYDFLHFVLGQCSSLEDFINLTPQVSILGIEDPVTKSVAPLHWIATDSSGECIVVEQTSNGLSIINNPIGVLANSPDILWHNTNLRNYMELSTTQIPKATWDSTTLTPFGQGGGSRLLPGGYTSPDRFVRTAFLKTHTVSPLNQTEAILNCFHIMESVSIPKGVILTSRKTYDYTKYIAFMDTSTRRYYIKTYGNVQIGTAALSDYTVTDNKPIRIGALSRPMEFEHYPY